MISLVSFLLRPFDHRLGALDLADTRFEEHALTLGTELLYIDFRLLLYGIKIALLLVRLSLSKGDIVWLEIQGQLSGIDTSTNPF